MRLFLMLFFIGLSAYAFSQGDFDKRLLAKYSTDQIADLQKSNNAVLDYYSFYLDNSYILVDSEKSGKQLISTENELRIKDLNDFNILSYKLTMDRNSRKIYKIKGSNTYLILLANSEFTDLYNRQRE